MKPIEFKGQTKVLQRPYNMTEADCSPLPIFTNGKQCISLWKANFYERIKFLFTGKMWHSSHSGKTQPPVWLKVNYPFNKGT
ncbi:hypothetical protein LCGC14_2265240 [marine sediment metagenome]|uniref:Uncharacterized protein n=1 Tax=marine sediment metagenome TaxID=412755 RepID=A0A0F9FAX2_9ZZZZ